MPRYLRELEPGQAFRLAGEGVEGTVVRVGVGSVLVRLHQARTSSFVTADGQEVSIQRHQRVEWSGGTRVEPQGGQE